MDVTDIAFVVALGVPCVPSEMMGRSPVVTRVPRPPIVRMLALPVDEKEDAGVWMSVKVLNLLALVPANGNNVVFEDIFCPSISEENSFVLILYEPACVRITSGNIPFCPVVMLVLWNGTVSPLAVPPIWTSVVSVTGTRADRPYPVMSASYLVVLNPPACVFNPLPNTSSSPRERPICRNEVTRGAGATLPNADPNPLPNAAAEGRISPTPSGPCVYPV